VGPEGLEGVEGAGRWEMGSCAPSCEHVQGRSLAAGTVATIKKVG
jgi:hypothetical protein